MKRPELPLIPYEDREQRIKALIEFYKQLDKFNNYLKDGYQ